MELIFNEFSTFHKAETTHIANSRMEQLLLTFRSLKGYNVNVKKIRFRRDYYQLSLSENYSIQDWLDNPAVRKTFKDLFRGIIKYPIVDESDENVEEKFISNYYYLAEDSIPELLGVSVEGLAVAFLVNSLAISLQSHPLWRHTEIKLLEREENSEKIVNVKHISAPDHIDIHREWLENNRHVEIVKTSILAENKPIKLSSDHHGNNILKDFAKRLNQSSYVIGTINSMSFNPKCRNFIHNCYPDGKIEIVLVWTDPGYGIIIQTTGRNIQETNYIAKVLEEKYSQ